MFRVLTSTGNQGNLDPICQGIEDQLNELTKQGKVHVRALQPIINQDTGKFLIMAIVEVEENVEVKGNVS